MKKCRTSRHWNYFGINSGKCIGILPTAKIIEKVPDKKGRKRGTLIVSPGISPNKTIDFVITKSDWSCANWKRVHHHRSLSKSATIKTV